MTKKTFSSLLLISVTMATIGLITMTDPANAQILKTLFKFLSMTGIIFIVLVIIFTIYTITKK